MRTIRTVAELRAALAPERRAGRLDRAGADDGRLPRRPPVADAPRPRACDVVVVSLFVNPTQFNESTDLAAYPRDEERDAGARRPRRRRLPVRARARGDVSATASRRPSRSHGLTEPLEGAHRGRGHFDGVATVVTKLLNIVGPDIAYFGQKDAQQALVIRRWCATSTSRCGSRSARPCASPTGWRCPAATCSCRRRPRPRAARCTGRWARSRRRSTPASATRRRPRAAGAGRAGLSRDRAEYLELVSPDTLAPLERIDGDVLALVAARVGATRLIDNEVITRLRDDTMAAIPRRSTSTARWRPCSAAPTTA